MSQTYHDSNPFMLMTHPEVVLAAIESSESLNGLNRHQCRPLDKPLVGARSTDPSVAAEDADDDERDQQLS